MIKSSFLFLLSSFPNLRIILLEMRRLDLAKGMKKRKETHILQIGRNSFNKC